MTAGYGDGSQEDVTASVTYSQEPLQAGMGSIEISYTYEGASMSAEQAITVSEPADAPNPDEGQVEEGDPNTEPSPDEGKEPGGNADAEPNPDEGKEPDNNPDTEPEQAEGQESGDVLNSVSGTENMGSSDPQETPGGNPDEPGTSDSALESGSAPEGTEETVPDLVVKNESTGIWVRGGIGEGTGCTVESVAKDSEQYRSYIEPVKDKVVLGVYDISLTSNLAEGETVEVGIPVGEQYNGKTAIVLHYDGSKGLERFTPVVTNGEVVVTVSGFSPYVVALDEEVPVSSPKAEQKTAENSSLRKAPKTGDEGRAVLWCVLFALSMFGMIYVKEKKLK